MVVHEAPPFSQVSRTTGTTIYRRKAILSTVRILPFQELYLDADITTIDTAEIQALRIHIQEIPGGEKEGELLKYESFLHTCMWYTESRLHEMGIPQPHGWAVGCGCQGKAPPIKKTKQERRV